MAERQYTALFPFCGIGGGALGFRDASPQNAPAEAPVNRRKPLVAHTRVTTLVEARAAADDALAALDRARERMDTVA